MPGETGPSLDDEGVPDLEGPLPEKEMTGDPQEGVAPPRFRPGPSVDWGITAEEQREGEPLDVRVRREVPDVDEHDPLDDVVADLGLDHDPLDDVAVPVEDEDPDAEDDVDEEELVGRELFAGDVLADDEPDAVADALATDPEEGQSAEEAAVHVRPEDDR